MRVLISSDKHDTLIINATDKDAACLFLMNHFDEECEYYDDFKDGTSADARKQRAWYDAAKSGNKSAAARLITYRKQLGYEYECDWRFEEVLEP